MWRTLPNCTNPKIQIKVHFREIIPGGGSPYKISVAHQRRKIADIGLLLTNETQTRVCCIKGIFFIHCVQLGYTILVTTSVGVYRTFPSPYTLPPLPTHTQSVLLQWCVKPSYSFVVQFLEASLCWKMAEKYYRGKGSFWLSNSVKRVPNAAFICPCLGLFLEKPAEIGYTFWPQLPPPPGLKLI